MNELVLAGYLKQPPKHIGSFKELHRFLSDKAAYHIGERRRLGEDQARHQHRR